MQLAALSAGFGLQLHSAAASPAGGAASRASGCAPIRRASSAGDRRAVSCSASEVATTMSEASKQALVNQTVIDDLFGGAMPKQEIQADTFIKVIFGGAAAAAATKKTCAATAAGLPAPPPTASPTSAPPRPAGAPAL